MYMLDLLVQYNDAMLQLVTAISEMEWASLDATG